MVIQMGVHYDIKPVQAYEEGPKPSPAPSPTPSPTNTNEDSRQLEYFFRKYNCPLLPYVQQFLDSSQKYNLDWRLLPAVSFKESTCGKHSLGNNPFGFGITKSLRYNFNSYEEAIDYVAGAISGEDTKDAKNYLRANKDPREILYIYNGKVEPGYGDRVLEIMEEIGQ
jgi:hypothetical protein